MSSKWFDTGLPCPCGKSSDAYAIDIEGDGFCFSCGKYFKDEEGQMKESFIDEENPAEPFGEKTYSIEPHRGISKQTMEFYGVFTSFINGEKFSVGYPYPNGSTKVRRLNPRNEREKFYSVGPIGEAHLFGENLFPPGSKESITVFEGEDDALAGYDMLFGVSACVSVKNAATAFGDVKARRDYINSFNKVYFCFDNDKAGRNALNKILAAGMFDYDKVYKVSLGTFKDAQEFIEDDPYLFKSYWESARRSVPDNILNAFGDIKNALENPEDEIFCEYPFQGLNEKLFGLCGSEMILLKGLEGIGKTEVCRAIAYKALKETDLNIGVLFLEEPASTTIKGIATYELGFPCNLRQAPIPNDQVFEGYKRALGGNESRLYIHSHFTLSDGVEGIVDSIRFLVAVAGVKLVLVDNLTMLTNGREGEDERLKIDQIIRRLRDLVNELHFCLILVAHVNDSGQTRGSRLPDKLCNTVLKADRNLLARSTSEKNITSFMIEKSRGQGTDTGPAGIAYFDPITMSLRNATPEDEIILPDLEESW